MLVQVKSNQPKLLAAVDVLEHAHPLDTAYDQNTAHGRIEERTVRVFEPVKALLPPEWKALITSIICVHRKTSFRAKKNQQQTREDTSWYICTAHISAADAAFAIRGHWGIEAQHYVRDVTFLEDDCRIRDNPTSFARIRTIALNILRHNQVQHISETIFRNAISFDHLLNLRGV